MENLPVVPPPNDFAPPPIVPKSSFAPTRGSFATPAFLRAAIVALAVLLLGGGGLYAYFAFTRPPSDVINRIIVNFSKLESYHFDVTLEGTTNEQSSFLMPFGKLAFSALPVADTASFFTASLHEGITLEEQQQILENPPQDPLLTPSFTGSFRFLLSGDVIATKGKEATALQIDVAAADATSGMSFGAKGEIRVFSEGKKFFAKIDDLTLPQEAEDVFALPPEIKGQWVMADEATLKQAGIDIEELTERLEERKKETKPSPQDQELANDFQKAFSDSWVLAYEGTEKIDGQSAFHYKARFDLAVFKTNIFALREKYLARLDEDKPAFQFLKSLDEQSFSEFEKAFKRMEGEAWILKRKHLPLKATFVIELKDDTTGQAASLNLELAFSQFDEKLTIEEPQDAIPFTQFLEGLLGTSPFGDPSLRARDAQRLSDLSTLRSALGLHRVETGLFPSTNGQLERITPETKSASVLCRAVATSDSPIPGGPVLPDCPTDPAGPPAFYGYRSDGQTYELTAVLDDPECDVEGATKEGELCIFRITGT